MWKLLNDPVFQKRVLLAALFLFAIFIWTVHPFTDSDQFYHLKAGQAIWEMKSVPTHDIFSYTAAGAPWITHEWLAELIFYGIYKLGGFWAVMYLVAALATATMGLLYKMATDRGAHTEISAMLLFLFAYLTFGWWLARPQVFAYFSFALLVYLLERYRVRPHVGYLYAAVATVWFWANVNASFILGIVILGLYFTLSLFRKYLPGRVAEDRAIPNPMLLGLAALAALAISFANPNGYHIFLYSWYIQPVVRALNVFEWRPILAFIDQTNIRILLAEMTLGDAFVVWWFGFRRESRDLALAGVTLGVSLLPFISIRHYAFWPLAVMVPLLVGVTQAIPTFLARVPRERLFAALVGIGIFFTLFRFWNFPRYPVIEDPLPVSAAYFADQIGLKGPRFNLYNEGGFLIWQDWPKEKVFVDGRSEVYAGQPLKDMTDIVFARPDWDALVNDKYHINYFFLAYRPAELAANIRPLVRKLVAENWPLVFWNDTTIIFLRNSPENQAVISQYGLQHVSPFRDPAAIPADEAGAAKEELLRALDLSPTESTVLQDYTSTFVKTHRASSTAPSAGK